MTELFIDGVSVVLPKDFSVPVKRENSFVTKNGEYTYDIALPLTNPINAELYKNINRLNSLQRLETKRSAVLIADNRVYCNGTEVITGWTESTVSIQVASGNSELNYFIGSDLLISSLDMKTTVPEWGDMEYITKTYPDIDYCLAPVVNRTAGYCINRWAYGKPTLEDTYTLQADDSYWFPQPFLCAFVKEVMRALGYDLQVNQIEDTVFKNLFICHVEETCKWNELLPGWTVKDFFEEIEKMFNAVFVVDNRNRTARLMIKPSYYAGSKSVHVLQVEDIYEAEIAESEEDVNEMASANVRYEMPDSTYYRMRCLPDDFSKKVKRDVIPESFEAGETDLMARIQKWFSDSGHQKKDVIYTDIANDKEFIYRGRSHNEGWSDFDPINEFKPLERENADSDVELGMVPVELAFFDLNCYVGNDKYRPTKVMIPVIDSSGNKVDESGESITDVLEQIENWTSTESESQGNLYLAFYIGLVMYEPLTSGRYGFPLPFTDTYTWTQSYKYWPTNDKGATLALKAFNKLFYEGQYDIDFDKAIKIQTHDPNVYDTRSVFEIRNKRYICKEMEFTLDANGRKGPWTGTFYPIRINDTEADARWILTDGKWRDGGVWLDNGRWLDD